MKIMLDPGHGKTDNVSPLNSNFYEGTSNFLFALELKRELEKYKDVEVLMTRNNVDDNPSLEERGRMAVNNKCDVFLSIHSNAYTDPTVYGVEGYYSVNTPLAKGLLEGLCNAVKINLPNSKVRKVVTKTNSGTDYYGVLRSSKGVAYSMLIEQGFHTNKGELACLMTAEWRKTVAELQARVFSDFFRLVKKPETVEKTTKARLLEIAKELQAIAETL